MFHIREGRPLPDSLLEMAIMKDEYDYVGRLPKQQIPVRVEAEVVLYFKQMAEKTGIPYQTIINLCLADCVKKRREIEFSFSQC